MTGAVLAAVLAAAAWAAARGGLRRRLVADRVATGAPWADPVPCGRRRRGTPRSRAARRRAVERVVVGTAEEVRAGASPPQGLRRAAAASADPLLRRLAATDDPVSLLPTLAGASGAEGLAATGAALRLAAVLGAAPSPLLDAVARTLRAETTQQREVDAELASAVATARLLAGLPVIGLALGYVLGADPVSVLLGSTAGRASLLAAVLLQAAGVAWTGRIRRRALG